jgi:hypothetical protein
MVASEEKAPMTFRLGYVDGNLNLSGPQLSRRALVVIDAPDDPDRALEIVLTAWQWAASTWITLAPSARQ